MISLIEGCYSLGSYTIKPNYLNGEVYTKDKLKELVLLCFVKKNGQRRYKYLVLGRDKSYFVKDHSDSNNKFSETDIIKMLDFLIDNIFVTFGGRDFQQTVGNGNKLCPSTCRLVSLLL